MSHLLNIGIVGSRNRNSMKVLHDICHQMEFAQQRANNLGLDLHIISGGCPTGADSFAEFYAKENDISFTRHPAKWKKHGRVAGPMRNTLIAEQSDILIAFPDPNGKGTQDTIKKFKRFHPAGELLIL